MKTPPFWYKNTHSIQSALLWPISQLYRFGHSLHQARAPAPYRAACPVICVGNLTAGGSGKTPSVLALIDLIKAHDLAKNPHILTRGYGGSEKGPLLLDSARHDAWQVGEEPLLLARKAPVIVSSDRAAGARLAVQNGADLIIMDDGLQNPGLIKDLSLVVIDGTSGFGNKQLIPAGPLREPLEAGFARADAFIIIGEDRCNLHALLPADKPVFSAQIKAQSLPDTGRPYVGFAGLGRPEKFKKTLEDCGLTLSHFESFADHHFYDSGDVQKLRSLAARYGASLITTEKDAVKLPEDFEVDVLPVCLVWDKETALLETVKHTL